MGFYQKYILPRFLNWAMQDEENEPERKEVAGQASGIVLEIGFGSGLNLPFYKKITKLLALDPSEELHKLAEERIKAVSFPIEYIQATAEKIPLADNSVDSVVSTWSFCSIPHPELAVQEVARVLKPGGLFIFIEHGIPQRKTLPGFKDGLLLSQSSQPEDAIWIEIWKTSSAILIFKFRRLKNTKKTPSPCASCTKEPHYVKILHSSMADKQFTIKKDSELIREYGKWLLVRKSLDLKSFGMNMVDLAPGGTIPEHTEVERDHEEVFFILKGTATMIIDGKQYDAPEGTFIRLDPEPQRYVKNNSAEPVRILIISAPRTSGYTPLDWA